MQASPSTQKKTQVKRVKRLVDGVLLLDKPFGFSSNQALQKVKWLFQAAKAGHTGTLDPLATGVLPICLGEATKFAQYLTDADKTYVASVQFGTTTTTGDAEGDVLSTHPVTFTRPQLEQAIKQFEGEISQVPPMYSALKHEGKALYAYAREGVEIERKARIVYIRAITLDSYAGGVAELSVTCSKGTYIRTLAEDIAHALGCGAHLIGLRRTATASYDISQTVCLETLESMTQEERVQLLLPVDSAIESLPKVVLNADAAYYLQQGQPVWQSGKIPDSDLRLYDEQHHFLGLGSLQSDGKIAPKRLLQIRPIKTDI
ncbi:MAG: tRNA pseudouridine(55) synthase TruB [Methylophilaceae bacterium 17-44-8]|nr:MAG: tRNA pseudouridine(55) synthase TruB [Methylophilales bacterium 28-44-11]OYZ10968.1 MAG: tRNA pseudouridine(55) synthase TruB [Methylophilales bacterium 16-45-7]OZA04851.1 MAG: tRNA pseudouridine(55) synthase TruB [Methylophilaceae bacterium 17-44-8]